MSTKRNDLSAQPSSGYASEIVRTIVATWGPELVKLWEQHLKYQSNLEQHRHEEKKRAITSRERENKRKREEREAIANRHHQIKNRYIDLLHNGTISFKEFVLLKNDCDSNKQEMIAQTQLGGDRSSSQSSLYEAASPTNNVVDAKYTDLP